MSSYHLDEIAKDLRFILEDQPKLLQDLLRRIAERIEREADDQYEAELLVDVAAAEAEEYASRHGADDEVN